MTTEQQAAFLDTIAVSEIGYDMLAESDNGYNLIFGSRPGKLITFDDYADHPRRKITATMNGAEITSTAAGRYQVLARYFDAYKRQLRLPDFGPESQDAIALQLIRECRALDEIEAGKIEQAIRLCSSRWASFPGAGYGQPEHAMRTLLEAFEDAGGVIA